MSWTISSCVIQSNTSWKVLSRHPPYKILNLRRSLYPPNQISWAIHHKVRRINKFLKRKTESSFYSIIPMCLSTPNSSIFNGMLRILAAVFWLKIELMRGIFHTFASWTKDQKLSNHELIDFHHPMVLKGGITTPNLDYKYSST